MTARDIRYGRQGGRVIPAGQAALDPATAPRCAICAQPMLLGQRRTHLMCTEALGYQHPQGSYPASTTLQKASPHHA